MSGLSARDRLIVALDQKTREDNLSLVRILGPAVTFYKVGWVTLLSSGVDLVRQLRDQDKRVFLDLKIFDVPNTTQEAVGQAAELGVTFATVHGVRANIEAATAGRASSGLKLLAVTVLTHLTESDARQLYPIPSPVSLEEHVVRVAERAIDAGCDGLIASPHEVAALRAAIPHHVLLVAPGIRMEGESSDDHYRAGRPYESIQAGADYLVVGRSIYRDPHPRDKAEQYVEEIMRGLESRP